LTRQPNGCKGEQRRKKLHRIEIEPSKRSPFFGIYQQTNPVAVHEKSGPFEILLTNLSSFGRATSST
jgi:hypothetical protein